MSTSNQDHPLHLSSHRLRKVLHSSHLSSLPSSWNTKEKEMNRKYFKGFYAIILLLSSCSFFVSFFDSNHFVTRASTTYCLAAWMHSLPAFKEKRKIRHISILVRIPIVFPLSVASVNASTSWQYPRELSEGGLGSGMATPLHRWSSFGWFCNKSVLTSTHYVLAPFVVRLGAPSSVLAPSSEARSP